MDYGEVRGQKLQKKASINQGSSTLSAAGTVGPKEAAYQQQLAEVAHCKEQCKNAILSLKSH